MKKMLNFKDLTVKQIRIFPNDYIPYHLLLRPSFINYMKQKYNFQRHEMPFDFYQEGAPSILFLLGGELLSGENKIIIKRLAFEGRKIVFEIIASSEIANSVFEEISEFIEQFDSNIIFRPRDAILTSEETTSIASLEISYMNVFSKEFRSFIESDLQKHFDKDILEINPKKLSFEVIFKPDLDLIKNKVTLSPKAFTIEPRGASLKEKSFYTESPFDSKTHIKLLEQFEKTFRSPSKK